jgi:hypothetical protein
MSAYVHLFFMPPAGYFVIYVHVLKYYDAKYIGISCEIDDKLPWSSKKKITRELWCLCCFGFWRRVISQIDANVSEKHTVSIFRAKITKLGSGGLFGVEGRKTEGVSQLETRNRGKSLGIFSSQRKRPNGSVSIVTSLRMGFDFWQGRDFLFVTASRQALVQTQPPNTEIPLGKAAGAWS